MQFPQRLRTKFYLLLIFIYLREKAPIGNKIVKSATMKRFMKTGDFTYGDNEFPMDKNRKSVYLCPFHCYGPFCV